MVFVNIRGVIFKISYRYTMKFNKSRKVFGNKKKLAKIIFEKRIENFV